MEEFDDWGLSAEQLDFLEEDAIRKISEWKSSSAAASASSSPLPSGTTVPNNSPHKGFQLPPSWTPLDSRYSKVEACSPSRLPPSDVSKETDIHCKANLPKLSVRFYLHASGAIAAKFPYDPVVIEAFHKIPKASWQGKERLWIFPPSSLATAEEVLNAVKGAIIEVQKLDPLVRRAFAAACAAPDLRDLYDRMPSYIKSKLLPFQQEGVRFVLQHGGRALLADEMGLGKTLQAIAVAACIHDAWPVLVITPSSLRLQWASMIQQWLNIPSSDILVVLDFLFPNLFPNLHNSILVVLCMIFLIISFCVLYF